METPETTEENKTIALDAAWILNQIGLKEEDPYKQIAVLKSAAAIIEARIAASTLKAAITGTLATVMNNLK